MSCYATVLSDLPCGERLAVWTVRRLVGPARQIPSCSVGPDGAGLSVNARPPLGLFLPCDRREFADVARAFDNALGWMSRHRLPLPDIAMAGVMRVTETERRLLAATAAAQAGHDDDARAALHDVSAHEGVAARLMPAITLLGACLAGAGYWLGARVTRPALHRAPHYAMAMRPCATPSARMA
ncbi:hypothetical protein [Novacetimonas pomaceti]|uniref:Uncharacterized protein n=1 Tax=Novacetimonas pomaceti TaxID=2021998 RepID=A0ABX5P2M5_9PROT|nr:hypothetical protein [Novacetimonas pomaceti]MBV1834986.1 hypothetical protein [Novacetimonas pomaceti]PYD47187.1 hypothetical protein C3920_11260 [Novacetimonas pomaceti]